MAKKLDKPTYSYTSKNFSWNRAKNRYKTYWVATHPPIEHTHAPVYSGGVNSHLVRIRGCESGHNYSAVSPGGQYRGAYQFSYSTWASVGGSGDPAAASPAEQDHRATILYNTGGPGHWPVCQSR